MTRARQPRPHEVQAAARDPRFLAARSAISDETWRTKGRCRTVDPETFFPLPTEPADMAMALCRSCPVVSACLRSALEAGDCEGVWGATTPRERRAMLVAWREVVEGGASVPEPALGSTLAPTLGGLRGSGRGSGRSLTHARHETVTRASHDEQYSTV